MQSVIPIVGIIFFSVVLIKAADVLATRLRKIANKTKMGGFFITALIVGLATSLPELFVGITSALDGVPNLSLGNAIGSNIADVTLVAGGAALLGGTVHIRNKAYSRDLLHAFLVGLAPLFLLLDNSLSRVDALILIAIYLFYNYDILLKRTKEVAHRETNAFVYLFRKIRKNHTEKHFMYVFLSLAVILFSADMIVKLGIDLSTSLQVPPLLIGLLFVSIGTSLPEFVVEFQAIRRHDVAVFLGDLLGSIVANGSLVVGITTLIHPITIQVFDEYLFATIFFLLLFLFFYFYVRTRQRLERWEGAILIFLYIVFMVIEFSR
ncbi:sodium:calcium antiporter [Candidatus Woesebacteria bacterium]|nr:sodium:calcium antiporter [Candidatus Woesebacteria bacterium]